MPASQRDPESLIPTAVKAAFTRACNAPTRGVRSGLQLPEFKRGRKKKKAAPKDGDEEMDEDEEAGDGAEGSDEEDEEPDAKRLSKLKGASKRGMDVTLKSGAELPKKKPAAAKKKPAAPKTVGASKKKPTKKK